MRPTWSTARSAGWSSSRATVAPRANHGGRAGGAAAPANESSSYWGLRCSQVARDPVGAYVRTSLARPSPGREHSVLRVELAYSADHALCGPPPRDRVLASELDPASAHAASGGRSEVNIARSGRLPELELGSSVGAGGREWSTARAHAKLTAHYRGTEAPAVGLGGVPRAAFEEDGSLRHGDAMIELALRRARRPASRPRGPPGSASSPRRGWMRPRCRRS